MNIIFEPIAPSTVPEAIGPYTPALSIGDFVFVSGQIGIDVKEGVLKQGVEAQARQALENMKAILATAGRTLDNVVKTTVFLADMADFAEMNEVYAEYFQAPFPARSAVAVKTLPKGARVEIECIAC